MDDNFFSDDHSDHASLNDEAQTPKIIIPRLTLLERMTSGQPIGPHQDKISAIELSQATFSNFYQYKTTSLLSHSNTIPTPNIEPINEDLDVQVFYSDDSKNVEPTHQSHYSSKKRHDQEENLRIAQQFHVNPFNYQGYQFQNSNRTKGRTKGKSEKENDEENSGSPKVPTRNILQYFWKVFRNYFQGKPKNYKPNEQHREHMKRIWQQVSHLRPTLSSFSKLFKNREMRPYFSQIFQTRFLSREIMGSSLRSNTKITYLRYIKILLSGFLTGDLQFLN